MSACILVVDDNQLNRKLILEILRLGGYQAFAACGGEEGVDLARSRRFDLILMDIQMPGVDGLEATRRIRREGASAGTPIVAVSALPRAADRARALAAGCAGYLDKPHGVEVLLDAVLRYLPPAAIPGTAAR